MSIYDLYSIETGKFNLTERMLEVSAAAEQLLTGHIGAWLSNPEKCG
jgi:hypothetical protein